MKNYIYGYHSYDLTSEAVLTEVSQSFCELVECEELKLLSVGLEGVIYPEDLEKYKSFVNTLSAGDKTKTFEYRVSPDGVKIKYLKCSYTVEDNKAFAVACDVTDIMQKLKKTVLELKGKENEKYYKALSQTFDKIFEYNFSENTVKFLYGIKAGTFEKLKNIPMSMRDATLTWVNNTVVSEDRERVNRFFSNYFDKNGDDDNFTQRIRYCAMSGAGVPKNYEGLFLKIDENISLFCCRFIFDENEADEIKTENFYLKNLGEDFKELVIKYTDGLMAFEVNGDRVRPLYTSENARKFFGRSFDQWLSDAENGISLSEFVVKARIDMTDVEHLLKMGESEFEYFDVESGKTCEVKAFCFPKTNIGNTRRYVLLHPLKKEKDDYSSTDIVIRTFGYFDVFVNGQPIPFGNKKAKELLALIVDRRGGFLSSEEAIGFLWENEQVNNVTLSRYRKVALRLKNILEEYGISHIIETSKGKRRIVIQNVKCDLYDYLFGGNHSLFKGRYLSNYSWGETTLGELSSD